MRSESVPSPASPETPPLAPYDPPEPAPQAAAWRRALKVVARASVGVYVRNASAAASPSVRSRAGRS
jgi:hypothetical protein